MEKEGNAERKEIFGCKVKGRIGNMCEPAEKNAQQLFREVHQLHRRLVEKRVGETGVFRSQHMTLMYISSHEGCSQKDIADAYRISGAAVAVNLKKLEKLGMVERIPDDQDNRCNRITTTPKGDEIVARSRSIFSDIDRQSFSELTDEEIEAFCTCLTKLRKKLTELLEEDTD